MTAEVTTVADDLIVIHDAGTVVRRDGLTSDTTYEVAGQSVRTLRRPAGELLCRFATVNDVHFGEVEAGRIDDHPEGPIMRAPVGAEPYPETMNRAAVAEMAADGGLAAVVVKGDLTTDGTDDEFGAFERCYGVLGDRLHVVRGNHDAYRGQERHAGDQWIELPGVAIALVDTTRPKHSNGTLSRDQLDWLDERAASAEVPILAMGHHQQWIGGERSVDYFGIDPDASDALAAVIERRAAIRAYTAGHTHRHRVRRTARGVPSVEVGCVKDFPGTWAEYRVYEGGLMQVVHRISSSEALAWSEQCRHLYADFGVDYASYALGTLEDRCFVF